MSDLTNGPIFHVEPKRWLGNRLIQYMVALHFQNLVPGSRISNVQIPEWDIDHPPLALQPPTETAAQHQHIEMAGLAQRARSGEARSIVYSGFGQRLENFPDLDACRAALRSPVVSPVRFDERHLICHVRANEIIYGGTDPNHPLTPVEFYADIIAETGLIPVFMGQTAPNDYMDRLRDRFPRALFLDTGDVILDFETIRQAKNIVIGVSTYAWLAAWLSHADRIFMAVSGLFNPMQYDLVDLLPFDDPRYRFYLFPLNYAVPIERHASVHRRMAPLWRQFPATLLRRMFREAPRFDPPLADMAAVLDPVYYLDANRDVAEAYGPDNADGAMEHFVVAGSRERRLPFKLSPTWYAARYPMAALEVAQGDYSTFAHHYVAVGRSRGYRPLPDDADGHWWNDARDEPEPLKSRAIAVLAREVVSVERPEPLGEQPDVSLGDSFASLLPAGVVQTFAPRTATEQLRAYRLGDVLLDVSMMALFNGRQPIPETLYMISPGDYDYALRKPLLPLSTDPDRHYIVGGNVAVTTFYHWMVQSLPAIDWGLRNRRHRNVALALPPLLPWQAGTLALLGYADVPVLTLDPSACYALGSAEYSEFLGERMARIVSRTAGLTYARVRHAVEPAAGGDSEIYVARTDATRRKMVNEAALIAMLERQGVRTIVPGSLPVAEQLAIFRRARLVIGPHGAGLSNIMACEPGTYIYELVPSHYPNVCFNRLAQTCGLHYWADVFPCETQDGDPHERNWCVDLDVIAARLHDIRVRIASAGVHTA